ncbi:uncharacterized protein LOC136006049 [Lathamus discolor]|uniref:uncharacterized protein LOC136006049 n=1 Tax=Lathamus discolor TaxID=678569 RepID=UPI0032B769F9
MADRSSYVAAAEPAEVHGKGLPVETCRDSPRAGIYNPPTAGAGAQVKFRVPDRRHHSPGLHWRSRPVPPRSSLPRKRLCRAAPHRTTPLPPVPAAHFTSARLGSAPLGVPRWKPPPPPCGHTDRRQDRGVPVPSGLAPPRRPLTAASVADCSYCPPAPASSAPLRPAGETHRPRGAGPAAGRPLPTDEEGLGGSGAALAPPGASAAAGLGAPRWSRRGRDGPSGGTTVTVVGWPLLGGGT